MILDIVFQGFVSAALAIVAVIFCRKPPPAGAYILLIGTGLLGWGLGKLSPFPFLIDVGHHNFIYSALGYAAGRGMPPENPFAAGMPAHFPWVAFAIYTEGAKLFGLTPGEVAKIGGIVCSAVAVTCICVIVRAWKPRGYSPRGLCVAAVTMALLAGTIFWGSFPKLGINLPLHPLAGGWWESRGIPLLSVFNLFTTPLGFVSALAAYAAFIISLVRNLVPSRAFIMFAGAAVSGIYPFAWFGLGLACAGAGMVALLLRTSTRDLIGSSVSLGLGALLGYAHIRTLRTAGDKEPIVVDLSFGELLFEIRLVLLYQAVLVVCCAINWRFFRDQWRQGQLFPFLLMGSVFVIDAATIALRLLDHTDYKLWLFATVCLGLLAAPTLYTYAKRAPLFTTIILMVLMFPLARSWWQGSLALRKIKPMMEVTARGGYLRAADPMLQAPYDWLAANTPLDAVIVERGTTWTPVFANRSLFIGKHDSTNAMHLFGFLNPIHIWLADFCGLGSDFVSERLVIVDQIFSEDQRHVGLDAISKVVADRDVFLVAKSSAESDSLDLSRAEGRVLEVASGDPWKIYRLVK